MKRLIISEGSNDVILVRRIYQEHIGNNYDIFLAEDHDEEIIPAETKRIRQFVSPMSSFNALFKSEEGRPNLETAIANLLMDILQFDMGFAVLADLDGDTIFELFSNINSHMDMYPGSVRLAPRLQNSNNEFLSVISEVIVNGSVTSEFGMIAFCQDLEVLCGISKGESRVSKEQKISRYIENSQYIVPAVLGLF